MTIHHMTDKIRKRLLNYESSDLVKQPNYELSYQASAVMQLLMVENWCQIHSKAPTLTLRLGLNRVLMLCVGIHFNRHLNGKKNVDLAVTVHRP